MGQLRASRMADGRTVLIDDMPPPGHVNPPLASLNSAYRLDDEERRDETGNAVSAASAAMATVLAGRGVGKRTQKGLRPTIGLPAAKTG